jgi:excisionase family DNA binding protein
VGLPRGGKGVGVQGAQVVPADSKNFVPPPSPGADGARLLTVREVARWLAVSSATVYTLCERGQLGYIRISNAIRVEPAEIEAFIARQQRG